MTPDLEEPVVEKHTTWWGEEVDILRFPDGTFGVPIHKVSEVWMPKTLIDLQQEFYLAGNRNNDSI